MKARSIPPRLFCANPFRELEWRGGCLTPPMAAPADLKWVKSKGCALVVGHTSAAIVHKNYVQTLLPMNQDRGLSVMVMEPATEPQGCVSVRLGTLERTATSGNVLSPATTSSADRLSATGRDPVPGNGVAVFATTTASGAQLATNCAA